MIILDTFNAARDADCVVVTNDSVVGLEVLIVPDINDEKKDILFNNESGVENIISAIVGADAGRSFIEAGLFSKIRTNIGNRKQGL